MGNEYRAKVFKSGNSLALRLPKALGLSEGMEMIVREDGDGYHVAAAGGEPQRIDLQGLAGSIPGLTRMPFDMEDRAWLPTDG